MTALDARPWGLLAFAALSTHELDATAAEEWRDLPLLCWITDNRTARWAFIALHVPLYAALMAGLRSPRLSGRVMTGLSAFSVVHVGLHAVLERHTRAYYSNWLSRSLIWGAGLLGAVDVAIATGWLAAVTRWVK